MEQLAIPGIGLGHLILEKLKETDPNRVLEVDHESGKSLTAREVLSQTVTVAQNLIGLGIRRGDIVIVYSKSNIKITPITFALYTIGAPINFFCLDLKGDDIKYYFELLNPKAILYEEEFKNDIFQALDNLSLSNLKHTINLDSETQSVDDVLFKPTTNDIQSFQPLDIGEPSLLPAVLAFTSGSTGRPKISIHSHSMILLGLNNKWWKMDPKSVVCTLADLRWISQIEIMLQPVFFGVKRIYTSKCEKDFDDSYEFKLLYENKVTHLSTVPILLLQTLQNAVKANKISKLSHLQTVLLGGEEVTESIIQYSAEIIPKCKIISCYGMTELHGIIASDEEVFGRTVNGGILRNGYTLKVLDELGNNLGPNQKGRLCLKSTVPFIGYFKNDEANEEHLNEDGWFTTEEYGYMDSDHLLNVITRYKYLLRYNGQFVLPTDIESILNHHPDVLTSALVGFGNPKRSDSEIGTLFVVLKDNSKLENMNKELLTLLRKNLTEENTKLVRFFKIIEKVPMCNSKVNRTELRRIATIESEKYLRI